LPRRFLVVFPAVETRFFADDFFLTAAFFEADFFLLAFFFVDLAEDFLLVAFFFALPPPKTSPQLSE